MATTGIQWQPKNGQALTTNGHVVEVVDALRRAFGDFPFELSSDDIDMLRGLAAYYTSRHVDKTDNPFEELISALGVHDSIRLDTY